MNSTAEFVVVGAGISGLAFANAIGASRGRDVRIVEREVEPGGYCRTVRQDGFVWDYSGHFFHFKHPEIEAWLRARMPGQRVVTVTKRSAIRFAGRDIDFPFQRNLHQLPQADFIACLADLYFAEAAAARHDGVDAPASFLAMLHARYGKGVVERFLQPYNEKLYACDLNQLDADAMGRFFPHARFADVMAQMRARASDGGYNATFTYPEGGAIEYVRALLHDVPADRVHCDTPVTKIDLAARRIYTPAGAIAYQHLVSSVPLPALAALCNLPVAPGALTGNQVLVFNLGFDKKGQRDIHWMYFPDPATSFYRVGWYDNIFDTERMSLYVELGMPAGAPVDLAAMRARVLADLQQQGVITDQQLLSWHAVVMNPAYCHISAASQAATTHLRAQLRQYGVHTIGRYGGWTYCSIEDNIVEARELAAQLGPC